MQPSCPSSDRVALLLLDRHVPCLPRRGGGRTEVRAMAHGGSTAASRTTAVRPYAPGAPGCGEPDASTGRPAGDVGERRPRRTVPRGLLRRGRRVRARTGARRRRRRHRRRPVDAVPGGAPRGPGRRHTSPRRRHTAPRRSRGPVRAVAVRRPRSDPRLPPAGRPRTGAPPCPRRPARRPARGPARRPARCARSVGDGRGERHGERRGRRFGRLRAPGVRKSTVRMACARRAAHLSTAAPERRVPAGRVPEENATCALLRPLPPRTGRRAGRAPDARAGCCRDRRCGTGPGAEGAPPCRSPGAPDPGAARRG